MAIVDELRIALECAKASGFDHTADALERWLERELAATEKDLRRTRSVGKHETVFDVHLSR